MGARAARSRTALAVLALTLAACGSSNTAAQGPPAKRVCDGARQAASRVLGEPVQVRDLSGEPVAYGLSNYSSTDLARIQGAHSARIAEIPACVTMTPFGEPVEPDV